MAVNTSLNSHRCQSSLNSTLQLRATETDEKYDPTVFTLLNKILWEIKINMQVKTIKACEIYVN